MPTLTMSLGPDLRIAELLAARLCHELAGPITAVANGADLLGEPGVDVDREALALLSESARRASSRLQFYRFAYGFGDKGPATGAAPHELAAALFETSRVACHYECEVQALPLVEQQLGCNLLVFGAEALARGGNVAITVGSRGLRLLAAGEIVAVADEKLDALALATPVTQLTSRTAHAYFTGLLAQALGWRLLADTGELGRLHITAAASAR